MLCLGQAQSTGREEEEEEKDGLPEHLLPALDHPLRGLDHLQCHRLLQRPPQPPLPRLRPRRRLPPGPVRPGRQDAGRQGGGGQEDEAVPYGGDGVGFGVQHLAVQGHVLLVQEVPEAARVGDGGLYQDSSFREA